MFKIIHKERGFYVLLPNGQKTKSTSYGSMLEFEYENERYCAVTEYYDRPGVYKQTLMPFEQVDNSLTE